MTCREAVLDDLGAICALGVQVNDLHAKAWPHVFTGDGDAARHAAHWKQGIGGARSTTFVYEAGAKVVGFVSVVVVQESSPLVHPVPYGRVNTVCVDRGHRGQGIGRALMRCAEQWVLERGATDMRLNVWSFNQRALALYAELGYEVRSHQLGKRLPPADAPGAAHRT